MPPRPPSPELSSSRGFRPEKFQAKSTGRDYAIYGLMLLFLAALVGIPLYYYTRSKAEKDQLRAKFGSIAGTAATSEPSAPATAGSLSPASAPTPVRAEPAPLPPTGSVSAYAGRSQTGVVRSEDPKRPEPSPEFLQFAETVKVSGVVQGNPARAILNGRSFRAGDPIDSTLEVTFAGLDAAKKHVILRDVTGAELRLLY